MGFGTSPARPSHVKNGPGASLGDLFMEQTAMAFHGVGFFERTAATILQDDVAPASPVDQPTGAGVVPMPMISKVIVTTVPSSLKPFVLIMLMFTIPSTVSPIMAP